MKHTKELLASAARFNHLQETRPDLLNSRHVGRKDTEITGHSRHVYLSHLDVVVERLESEQGKFTYLVGHNKAELQLVTHSLSISTTSTNVREERAVARGAERTRGQSKHHRFWSMESTQLQWSECLPGPKASARSSAESGTYSARHVAQSTPPHLP